MKRIIALIMALAMLAAMAACAPADNTSTPGGSSSSSSSTGEQEQPVKVLTYEEYMAAAVDTIVTVETYVQATQSWWNDQISIYGQGTDGGYFFYNISCSQEDAAKLTPGTKIRVTGKKGDFRGEIEVMGPEDSKLEIIEAEPYIAEPQDLTSILGNAEELIKKQNVLAAFKGLTITQITYKNGEPGDDIYVTVTLDGNSYSFCVERYLTGPESELYKAFTEETVKVGDIVNIEGFVYWYDAVNTHMTAIEKVAA